MSSLVPGCRFRSPRNVERCARLAASFLDSFDLVLRWARPQNLSGNPARSSARQGEFQEGMYHGASISVLIHDDDSEVHIFAVG